MALAKGAWRYYDRGNGGFTVRKRLWGVAVALAILVMPSFALAYSWQADQQNVTLPKGETKNGTFYAMGQNVTIDGDVNGDLICAASTVVVNGAVHGDVLCAGQLVTVNGPVDGSVRLAGQSVSVNGAVGRNATMLAQAFTLGGSARVNGDLGALSQNTSINGTTEKELYGAFQTLSIGGAVAATDVMAENLTLGSNARVNGTLKYMSDNTFTLDKAKVGGEIQRVEPPVSHGQREAASNNARLMVRLYWILAATVTGLVLAALMPRAIRRVTHEMRGRVGASFAWGAIVTVMAPIVAVVLAMTVLGAPLGALIAVLWGLMLATSGVFGGIAVGQWLLVRADWHKDSLVWAAAFGVPLVVILFSIPGIGGLLMFAALLWGVGGMSLATKALRS